MCRGSRPSSCNGAPVPNTPFPETRCTICGDPLPAPPALRCGACWTLHEQQSDAPPARRLPRLARRLALLAVVLAIAGVHHRRVAAPEHVPVRAPENVPLRVPVPAPVPAPSRPQRSVVPRRRSAHPRVESIAFSPDGELVAVCGESPQVRIYSARTGERIRALNTVPTVGHRRIMRLAWSRSGGLLAGGGDMDGLVLWDASSGRVVRWLRDGTDMGSATGLAFAPDGTAVYSSSEDRKIRRWEVRTGRLCASVDSGSYGYTDVSVSGAGARVTFRGANQVRVCDAVTLADQAAIEIHDDRNACRRISPDGRWIAIGGYRSGYTGATIVLADARSGAPALTMQYPRNVVALAFAPDGDTLFAIGWSSTPTCCYDLRTGALRWSSSKDADLCYATLDVSPDGSRVAVGTIEGAVRILDAKTGEDRVPIIRNAILSP